jgi:anti-sigma regulatory factor (Ser/Thr protein kinase)
MHVKTSAAATGVPSYSESYPRDPQSAAQARQLVGIALETWHLHGLVDSAQLVVSELVANATQHARAPVIRVTVTRRQSQTVRVSVSDRSRELPHRVKAEGDDEHGRGLALIEALACQWGVDERRSGKCVWADLGPEEEPAE